LSQRRTGSRGQSRLISAQTGKAGAVCCQGHAIGALKVVFFNVCQRLETGTLPIKLEFLASLDKWKGPCFPVAAGDFSRLRNLSAAHKPSGSLFFFFPFLSFSSVLRMEPPASHRLGQPSTSQPQPSPSGNFQCHDYFIIIGWNPGPHAWYTCALPPSPALPWPL
jgi:hypothetical protein